MNAISSSRSSRPAGNVAQTHQHPSRLLPQSGCGAERRIAIGREQERVGCNPEPPPEHSDDEVEEGARIATRKQYREPGSDDAEERQDAEAPEDDVVRNRQEPLDERQPAIQLLPRIGVGNLKV